MTKNAPRHKKGISPVLATLLLAVIAVAAIVVTYAWIMTYISNGQTGVKLYAANVNFNNQGSTKRIDIDVGNSGTSETKLIQVYVGSSPATMQNYTITPVTLLANTIQRITVDCEWQNGVIYHFKVASSSGQFLEWSKPAPSNP